MSEQPLAPMLEDTASADVEILQNEDGGKVILPNGAQLSYTRTKESRLYVDKLKLLAASLRNDPCLPTEVLFKDQDPEALSLVRRYIQGIGKIVEVIEKHGSGGDFASYSFRLPHMLHLDQWLNVVVRLQFATSLKTILDTLNANLSDSAEARWGVLEINEEGRYVINGEPLADGTPVDVFTTDERILTKVIFGNHSVVNCVNVGGHSAPVFHYNKQQMENMSAEDLAKRAQSNGGLTGVKLKEGEHLLGTDAWSFLQGVLYRISLDEEEVIDISTDIFTKLDYDPAVKVKDYTELAHQLNDNELPYGLHISLLGCLRDYYCKNVEIFNHFKQKIDAFYQNPVVFRNALNANPYLRTIAKGSFTITSLYDLLRLIDGKSKVLRIKLVMFDGRIVDAVTITRPLTMPIFGSFNRFNPTPLLFQRIEFTDTKRKVGILEALGDKMRGIKPTINRDNFVLTEETITSDQVVGYINAEAKAYYFDEESSIELDDKFAMYHLLSKKFKRINKGLE